MPEETQYDVRAFFGTYTKACSDADHLLYAAGTRDQVEAACRKSNTGKKTPTALSPALRLYEGCAKVLTGNLEGANVVKLHRDKAAVSYLWYPSFDDEGHPDLAGSFIVFLVTQQVRYRDYTAVDNPPILHRKEEFVAADYPLREDFAALTEKEERMACLKTSLGLVREAAGRLYSRAKASRLKGTRSCRLHRENRAALFRRGPVRAPKESPNH